jgi:hypothetical protein
MAAIVKQAVNQLPEESLISKFIYWGVHAQQYED